MPLGRIRTCMRVWGIEGTFMVGRGRFMGGWAYSWGTFMGGHAPALVAGLRGKRQVCAGKRGEVKMAEGQGFEPWMPLDMPVFKTGAFNRSATPPGKMTRP